MGVQLREGKYGKKKMIFEGGPMAFLGNYQNKPQHKELKEFKDDYYFLRHRPPSILGLHDRDLTGDYRRMEEPLPMPLLP